MIITKIGGGLGNQMFQYALGRVLSIRNNDVLKLDITAFSHISENKYSVRHFELDHFSIAGDIATEEEISRIKYPLKTISRYLRGVRARLFKDTNIRFDPKVLERKGDIYLDGYWQSEQYFMDHAEIIRKDFTPSNPLSPQALSVLTGIRNQETAVSLHIRRGDNAYNADSMKKFGMPATDYYINATKVITESIGTQEIHLYIFSDDIEWVRENLTLPYTHTYVSQTGIADWEEILLMSTCTHHIIANSTFSWWGAWLNPNPEKVIIAPLHWANVSHKEFSDIIPSSWIRI